MPRPSRCARTRGCATRWAAARRRRWTRAVCVSSFHPTRPPCSCPRRSAAAMRCDALVVGAGPAGSVAARVLAQGGLDVVLADRHSFPRDKACGDALIPDALAALRRLGLHERVLDGARSLGALDIYAPGGARVRLAGPAACLPRVVLDDALRRAAESAGARFLGRHLLAAPVESAGAVRGAVLRD